MDFKELLELVVSGESLSENESEALMESIMEGIYTPAQIGGIITALRMKGESIEEITGLARGMRKKAEKLPFVPEELVDIVGTGGDGKNTFNVSTATALVVAAAGVSVAKHGNRSVSSKCGSADVLEALGVNINLSPIDVSRCMKEIGFGFLFAPLFHKAMKFAAVPRKELGIRTVFNILGPLTNPARAENQVMGVFKKDLTEPLAKVLGNLGVKNCYVVHGMDGTDEISVSGLTQITEMHHGKINTFMFHPSEVGIPTYPIEAIIGGSAQENKDIIIDILLGTKGAKRDIVVLNTAFALLAAHKVYDVKSGVELAGEVIDSGAAYQKLMDLVEFSKGCAA